jgi:hypothetical protein
MRHAPIAPASQLHRASQLHPRSTRACAGWSARIELLGISTVAGNQTVEKVTRNALDVLHLAGLQGTGPRARP